MSETKVCDACGQSMVCVDHRSWAKHVCPKALTSAVDAAHPGCPVHGTLVWVVGPYSTFRTCGARNCTAGKRGKPYRFCAPRGRGYDGDRREAVESGTDAEAPDTSNAAIPPVDTEGFPPTKYATHAKASTVHSDINLAAFGQLGESIQSYVDARAAQLASEMILEALKDAKVGGPQTVDWTVNSQPFATVTGAHHRALPEMLKLYAMGFRNFLVVGPAGSGKTTLAHNLATALGVDFGSVSCTSGMSESALTGRAIPNLTTGATAYQSTDFVRAYEGGSVFLIDEVDAADPNVMLAINSALANGHMPLPNRDGSPSATRHEGSIIVCAANTWGNGADRAYVGRNQLDAAFLDRFVGVTLEVGYDRDLESQLVGDAHICARVWTMRDKVTELGIRRVVGTRFLMSVARLVKAGGESIAAALTRCTVGWTKDELSRVGVL